MKQEDTRQKILDKALELFAAKGYDSVSVGEIAQAVGIKAPSLYNHFPGKQAIFDAIVEATAAQYEADTDRIDIHVQDVGQDIPAFTEITEDALFEKVRQIFSYSLHNETLPPHDDHRAVPLAGVGGAVLPALCRARAGLSCRNFSRPDRGRRNLSGGPGHAGDAVCRAGRDAPRRL